MKRGSAIGVLAPLVKLSVFAVITIILTAMLASTIASMGFATRTSYRAHFTDVTGLLPGDDVRIAGVKVGEVEKISVVQRTIAEVTFSVAKDERLDAGILARIRYRNLVGQRYVALTEGKSENQRLRADGLIPLAHTEPALDLTVLFNGFKPLFSALDPQQVNTFAYEIIRVLQGEGGTINSLLAKTASLTNTLADRDALIGSVIDNLNSVLATVNTRDQQLSELILQLQRFVSGLAEDRQALGDSLANISTLAESTASLVTGARPALKRDIAALGQVSKTLNASRSVVDGVLKRLPRKLDLLTATASDGSWFNFYLCSAGGKIAVDPVLPAGAAAPVTPFVNSDPRCQG
jgi:phospholipid/cholesterol/gamma-HCH transport system substrate-binding protein